MLIRAFLERAGERPTCSKLARRKRLAEIGTKRENRSRARGRSTASSRARRHLGRRQPEMTAARAYVVSSCRSYLLLEGQKFAACGAVVLRQRRLFPCPKRGTRRTEEMVVSMASIQATSSTLLLVRCKGVDMDVRYANMGNSYSIMRRFTRH